MDEWRVMNHVGQGGILAVDILHTCDGVIVPIGEDLVCPKCKKSVPENVKEVYLENVGKIKDKEW